jgi:plasmid stability protein
MATIQIRDLPDDAYDVLRRRARDRGQSLQAYMRESVIDLAFTPTKAEIIMEIERSLATHGGVPIDQEMMRAAREEGRR